MKIAVLSPVWFPVPPTRYGGIEWVVSLLADGLVSAGHDVTLFASGDSSTSARLASSFDEAPSEKIGVTQYELRHALACFERAGEFDVINDHSGPLGALCAGSVDTPVLHTVHGPLGGEPGLLYASLAQVVPQVGLISLSLNQRKPFPDLNWAANCPNALELEVYPVHPRKGDYLLFLGRMSADKGCHRAIEVAKEAGLSLLIAGKMQDPAEKEYFEEQVRPNLGWGIEYLGEVDHDKKIELLQNARVTLFPIQWEEPFGLVMIESMACGTPVLATRWGAVPEVIEDGRTGIIVDDYLDMAGEIERAAALDPLECRRYVEERFSSERMVRDYENAYRAALDGGPERSESGSALDLARAATTETSG
jgi:glycosyltransferase involved in cell wall biosynthesis